MALLKNVKTRKQVVNGVTEMREHETFQKSRVNVPFFMAFCEEIGRLFDLTGNELKLFIQMAKSMDHDNIVRITGYDRENWASGMGMTINSFNITMSRLQRNRGFIKRIAQSAYMIDPEIFNKGQIDKQPEKAKVFNIDFRVTLEKRDDGFKRKVKARVSSDA